MKAMVGVCILFPLLILMAGCGNAGPGLPLEGWNDKLSAYHPAENNPHLNGTADGGVPYNRRLANIARYSNISTPVKGFYGPGYGAIVAPDSPPVYYVDKARNRLQTVLWVRGSQPAGIDAANGLQQHFLQVPIPTGPNGERFDDFYKRPITGGGPDQQLVIYDAGTGEMWEMWLFRYNAAAGRYEMGYGGYSPDTTEEDVAYKDMWGARATSIPLAAGIMLQREYMAGVFDHPLAFSIPVVKRGFIPPATREDEDLPSNTVGGDARDAIPEGAWFRLPPNFPIDPKRPKLLPDDG